MLDLVQHWNRWEDGNANADRTLKSEVLGEWEALSRTAKVRWAEREGHDWLSLQHDGVVIALRRGVSADEARTQLQLVSGAALGYQMPVEIKQMKTDAAAPAPVVEPAQGRSFGGGGGGGGGIR